MTVDYIEKRMTPYDYETKVSIDGRERSEHCIRRINGRVTEYFVDGCTFNDVFTRLFPKVKSSHITALVNAIRRCNNDYGVNDVQETLDYIERLNFNE